jgi:hypothetical protein
MKNRRGLTPYEQEMWTVQSAAPQSTAYNIGMAFDLRGRLDERALAAAIDVVVARHAALRSAFPTAAGSPCRVLVGEAPSLPRAIPVAGGSEERARALFGQWIAEPFDLANGPLFRARLLRLAPERHVLAMGLHNIITDRPSMDVIGEATFAAYEAMAGGASRPADWDCILPPVDAEEVSGPVCEVGELQQYWRERLGPLGPGLPALMEPRTRDDAGPKASEMSVGPGTGEVCHRLARQERTSFFVVSLTAFVVFLHRWTGPHPVAVATPVDLRYGPAADRSVGLHVNLLPIVLSIDRADSFRAAVRQVRNTFLQDLGHAELPFCQIAALAGGRPAPGQHPVAQTTFQVADRYQTTYRAGLATSTFSMPPSALARFPPAARTRTGADFAVQAWMYDDAVLSGALRTGTSTAPEAPALAAGFGQAFSDLLSAPDVPVSSLHLGGGSPP